MLVLLLVGCGLDTYGEQVILGPSFSVEPEGEILFEKVPADKASSATFSIVSTGDERVVIDTITLTGPGADSFVLPSELPLPLSLIPDARFPVTLSFEPSAKGQFSALIEVTPLGGFAAVQRRVVATACDAQGGATLCPPEGPSGGPPDGSAETGRDTGE